MSLSFEVWLRTTNWAWMVLPNLKLFAVAENFKRLTTSLREQRCGRYIENAGVTRGSFRTSIGFTLVLVLDQSRSSS